MMDGGLVGWEAGIAADAAAVKSKRRVGLSKVYLQAGRAARVYCKRTQENGEDRFLAGRWEAWPAHAVQSAFRESILFVPNLPNSGGDVRLWRDSDLP
jgi:hypothetical protein